MTFLQPSLKIKRTSNGTLELVLHSGFRVFFLLLAGLTLLGIVSYGAYSLLAFLFLAVFILAGLYNERWIFNRSAEEAVYHFGLLFPYRARKYALSDIQYIELREFTRGKYPATPSSDISARKSAKGLPYMLRQNFSALSIISDTQDKIDIEIRNSRYKRVLKENGQAVAEYCGKPFVER